MTRQAVYGVSLVKKNYFPQHYVGEPITGLAMEVYSLDPGSIALSILTRVPVI